ncbi:hypothetical protein [Pseudophaeobacter sp. EL27]|nr:hypothetical protein [Pseudophaeobacter sp. EL27]
MKEIFAALLLTAATTTAAFAVENTDDALAGVDPSVTKQAVLVQVSLA